MITPIIWPSKVPRANRLDTAPAGCCPPLLTDSWRCGRVFSGASHARQLAGHEAYCKGPGSPPAAIPCRPGCGKTFAWRLPSAGRKQPHHAREFRSKHEKICRGSDADTRICPICSQCQDSAPNTPPPTKSMWKCPQCSSRCAVSSKAQHAAVCRGSVNQGQPHLSEMLLHPPDCRG